MKESFEEMRDSLFDSFSDFVDDGLIQDGATATYNPATGGMTIAYSVSITEKVFLSAFKAEQIGGEVLPGDVKITVKSGTEIYPNAKITVGSTKYNVISNNPVTKSQGIIQKLHCRAV